MKSRKKRGIEKPVLFDDVHFVSFSTGLISLMEDNHMEHNLLSGVCRRNLLCVTSLSASEGLPSGCASSCPSDPWPQPVAVPGGALVLHRVLHPPLVPHQGAPSSPSCPIECLFHPLRPSQSSWEGICPLGRGASCRSPSDVASSHTSLGPAVLGSPSLRIW